jgi:hypothetical protein
MMNVEQHESTVVQALPIETRNGSMWASIACSLVALLLLPPFLGAAAIYFALKVRKVRPAAGNILLGVAIACTIVGVAIGAITYGGGAFR